LVGVPLELLCDAVDVTVAGDGCAIGVAVVGKSTLGAASTSITIGFAWHTRTLPSIY
jgi:hypothetical protein